MKGLIEQLAQLGLSVRDFERFSEISYPTLQKIDAGLKVRSAKLNKVKACFEAIKALQLEETKTRRLVSNRD